MDLLAPQTSTVVVAARPIDGGHVVEGADVALARWPVDLVPDGAMADPADVVGRTLPLAVSRGEPFAASRVAGAGAGTDLAGRVNVVVGLADTWAAVLAAPGVQLDVYPTPGGWDDGGTGVARPRPLARGAVVVRLLGVTAATDSDADQLGVPSGPSASGGATALVLAVTPDEAADLAALAGQGVMISTSLPTASDQ